MNRVAHKVSLLVQQLSRRSGAQMVMVWTRMILEVFRQFCRYGVVFIPEWASVLQPYSVLRSVQLFTKGIFLVDISFLKKSHSNVLWNNATYFPPERGVERETTVAACVSLCRSQTNAFAACDACVKNGVIFRWLLCFLDRLDFQDLQR